MTLFKKPELPKNLQAKKLDLPEGVQAVAPSELVKRIIASPAGVQSVLVLKTDPSTVIADIIKSVKSREEAKKIHYECFKARYKAKHSKSLIEGIPVGVVPAVVEEPKVAIDSSGNPTATFKGDWLLVLPREGYLIKEDFSINNPLMDERLA